MRAAPLAALVLLAAAAAMNAAPRARMGSGGDLEILLPDTVLSRKEVTRQLTSGLTTAFVLRVDQRKLSGGARVEIRYDLWEETYVITVIEFDGSIRKARIESAKLAEWWRGSALRVLRAGTPLDSVQARLQVLPFSAREEADAERWLSDSVSTSPKKNAATDSRSSASGLLDVIIGTSVQRRPILEFRWTIRVEGGR